MAYMIDTKDVKRELNKFIVERIGSRTVQSGPFKGMTLLPDECWIDGNDGPKLLGCYEQELHQPIERVIKILNGMPRSARIVNIGCAEGFYAVGFARRCKSAIVSAFDLMPKAIEITRRNAEANGVFVYTEDDVYSAMKAPDLVFSDCEGAEVLYLDLDKFPGLAYSNIIVECHDSTENPCNPVLCERFKATHSIDRVIEGARNPNEYKILWGLDSSSRWIAISESRPCVMDWLVMMPHQPQAS